MTRPIAISAAAVLLGIIALTVILFAQDRGAPDVQPTPLVSPPEVKQDIFTDHPTKADLRETLRVEIDKRFPDAPDNIRQIAFGIADPKTPLSEFRAALDALTSEEVLASYGHPFPEKFPEYSHTLMREAVMAGNTGVAAILAEKGADLGYNDNEMAFQSVSLAPRKRDWELAFPDYTPGAKLLSLWLRHSNDVNITHPLYDAGTLLFNTPINNLTGIFLLLESGADPWSSFAITAEDGGFLYELEPFFVQLVGHDRIANEVAFRAAVMGYYDNAPSQGKKRLVAAYDDAARSLGERSSPRDGAERWALGKTIKMVYSALDTYPSDEIKDRIYGMRQDIKGGFYLDEDELHSPYRPSQRMDAETPWGPHQWIGVPSPK